jgi:parvulin-like peptidyl-prolyl isomerase
MNRHCARPFKSAFGLLFFLMTAGCWQQKPAPMLATIALVNDEAITLQELQMSISETEGKRSGEMEATVQEKEELKRRLLDQLIERKMLLQEARRLRIELPEGEVQQRFDELMDGKDEQPFLQSLSDKGLTKETWERSVRENLLIEKLLNQMAEDQIIISDEEMLQYYGNHLSEWTVSEQVKLRQIVFKTSEEAERLRHAILEGADFVETARTHSQWPGPGSDGDMGYLTSSEIPPEFDPLFEAEIGSMSEVIKTPFGYHLVKVEGRQPARTLPFEEVKEKIYLSLLDEKREALFAHWMENVRRKTEVKINEELLHKIS